ncbi:MAG: hypothetical protein JST54_26210 [Deltaproteobacteria bacterium]|nr:hypothetical protein [Deltaproteobacteria bacterium]
MGVWQPLLAPLVALFGGVAALLGMPLLLADAERRPRRVGLLVVLGCGILFVHGELRSVPVVHAGMIGLAGALTAALSLVAARRWILRRAMLAERPRSPDELADDKHRRLWAGTLRSPEPLPALDGAPACLYRRVEVDRWDAGRWRRISTREAWAELVELHGRTRSLALSVPPGVLRRAAVELLPARACDEGWRLDADPDPAALYRSRTVGLPDGAPARVLGRVVRREQGPSLVHAGRDAFSLGDDVARRLAREAGLCAAAAALCTALGLWGAWP